MNAGVDTAFSIVLPGGWVQLDPQGLSEGTAFDELIGDRVAEIPEIEPLRDLFIAYGRAAATLAQEQGVTFSAILVDVVDEEAVPVVAALEIAFRNLDPDVTPDPLSLHDEPPAQGRNESEVTPVVLPAGPALRIERVFDGQADLERPQAMTYSLQYLVHLAHADQVVALTFTSPTIAVRDGLATMFDRIAQSFRATEVRP